MMNSRSSMMNNRSSMMNNGSSMMNNRSSMMNNRSSMSHMSGFNGLTSGLRDFVLNVHTCHLGHGVAVLNLNGDELHLGVVHAVLGGNLATCVLHSSLH